MSEKDPFLTEKKMTKYVEQYVLQNGVDYIDAVVDICEKYSIELEDVKPMLSKVIISKIKSEAMQMNMLKEKRQPNLERFI